LVYWKNYLKNEIDREQKKEDWKYMPLSERVVYYPLTKRKLGKW
jgi:ribonuclease D